MKKWEKVELYILEKNPTRKQLNKEFKFVTSGEFYDTMKPLKLLDNERYEKLKNILLNNMDQQNKDKEEKKYKIINKLSEAEYMWKLTSPFVLSHEKIMIKDEVIKTQDILMFPSNILNKLKKIKIIDEPQLLIYRDFSGAEKKLKNNKNYDNEYLWNKLILLWGSDVDEILNIKDKNYINLSTINELIKSGDALYKYCKGYKKYVYYFHRKHCNLIRQE